MARSYMDTSPAVICNVTFARPCTMSSPLAPGRPRQRIEFFQHRCIRAVMLPRSGAWITRKVAHALFVAFTERAKPLKITERTWCSRGDLVTIQIKHLHSMEQQIGGIRIVFRNFAKFGPR